MNNKKLIILAVCLIGSMTAALAQDVTVLHMKDGTKRYYKNGVKEQTHLRFCQVQTDTDENHSQTVHDNGYAYDWPVTAVGHRDGQYAVVVGWGDYLPDNFQARRGLCFSTTPGKTIADADTTVYCTNSNIYYDGTSSLSRQYRYCVIGSYEAVRDLTLLIADKSGLYHTYQIGSSNNLAENRLDTTLQYGQTYYYRTFAKVQTSRGEEVYYGPEHSFTVPRVMDDAGYFAEPAPTPEAWTAFQQHFPDSVTAPEGDILLPLLRQWQQTEEGRKTAEKDYAITSEQFDDGTGYRINHVPEAFYTWLVNREIVLHPRYHLSEIQSVIDYKTGEKIIYADSIFVENADAAYGIPGNQYMRFEPIISGIPNFSVTYQDLSVMPGVNYEVKITFAPETRKELADSAILFQPTMVRPTYSNSIGTKKSTNLATSEEVSATEVTTLTYSLTPQYAGADIMLATRVTARQYARSHNRIFRVAEIRFTPKKSE